MGLCMLTNMSNFGAENAANEMYHAWFGDGTNYDNAQTSSIGPAPAYLTGGTNPNYNPDPAYTGPALIPPLSQPIQKAYKDWNTSWPENSWEITEPSISYQASYVRFLSHFAPDISTPLALEPDDFQEPENKKKHFVCSYFLENKQLLINIQTDPNKLCHAKLLSWDGKTIKLVKGISNEQGELQFVFTTNELTTGLYILSLYSEDHASYVKLQL